MVSFIVSLEQQQQSQMFEQMGGLESDIDLDNCIKVIRKASSLSDTLKLQCKQANLYDVSIKINDLQSFQNQIIWKKLIDVYYDS